MLIGMAVYDNEVGKRTPMTRATLQSLSETVDWDRHRLFISDNGSIAETQALYEEFKTVLPYTVIKNGTNIGVGDAINRAWSHALPGEAVVKIDNDVVIHQPGWADLFQEAFDRKPKLGIIGLKRKDLEERPDHETPAFRSVLEMLPHERMQRWIVIEHVNHVIGTCQALSYALREKIGYLFMFGLQYGFEDALTSIRSHHAGFETAFLNGIEIDHIDQGGTPYTEWKLQMAAQHSNTYKSVVKQYATGERNIFYDGGQLLREYVYRSGLTPFVPKKRMSKAQFMQRTGVV